MSGLLDNLEKNNYSDGDEDDHINRLFPKCKPRASSLQPTSTTSNNATTGNAEDSLPSGSRTSLSGCSSLTNNHNNINTLNNNNNLYEDRYHDEDENNDTQIIQNGGEIDYDEDNNVDFRCLSSSKRATRASFVENNSNSSFVEKGHRTTTTTTASSALPYPGKATRANNPTASYKSANSRSARTRRSHHHHHHHHSLTQQQSNIEFGKDESSAGLHHISTVPSVALHKASSVKRNSCNQGRIMECNTLGDHFDNGVESGGSGSSGASALSHSSSFSLAAEKNVGNVGLSSSSGLGSSSASSGGSSAGNSGLRDSRIEIAGGREIFSQNRIKAGRRVRGSSSMESMVVAQQQQEQTTAGASSLASLAGNNSGSSLHHNQQQTYHHQESPSSGLVKGRRKSSSGTANPLISPTSPVASYNNIWEPHHPVANKKNFPFSSSSSSSSRGGGENRDRRYSTTASRHTGNGSHGYLRNSKSSHSQQSLYYPYHGRENPDTKKSPSLDGFDMMLGNKNPFPQVHQSPQSLKSPVGGLMMKETVFDTEITSIEKPLVVEGAEAVGGGNKQKPSFIYETPIGSGGEILFDDIEDHHWRREQQRRMHHQHDDKDGTFTSPCGSVGGGNVEKSPLSLGQNMKSDDGGDDDEESDSPVIQQQYQHRRMLHHHHHHHPQQQHTVPADAGIPRGPTSPFSNPTGYESDECASSSVLADNSSRTSPYNGNKRLIGNIPIAEYEGSPKRYGLRLPTEAKPSHLEIIDPNSPTITHLSFTSAAAPPPPQLSPRLSSPSSNFATTRLPGFPHRVVDTSQQQPQLINNTAPTSTVKPVLSESPTTATTECIIGERRESEGGSGHKSDDVIMSAHARSDGGGLSGRNSPVVGNVVSPTGPLSSSATASSGPGKMFGIGTTTDTSPDDSIASQQGSNNTATNSSEDPEAELSGHAGALNRCDLSGLEEEDNYLLYEFSETRKVLDEFFKPPEEDGRLIGFDDLDYTLRRQAGNSYVGQRLAAVEISSELGSVEESPKKPLPHRRNVQLNISSGGGASPKLISFQEVLPVSAHNSSHNNNKSQSSLSPSSMVLAQGTNVPSALLDPSARDVNDNDIEIETASTNTETDLGDTEVGLQVGHSRNFTLSPETTDCDSNELESEISLDFEASIHSSSRIGATMPVLEDGLSSGNVSDNEDPDQDEMFERSTRALPLASRKLNSSKMLLPSSQSSCTAAVSNTVPNCAPTESNPTLLLMKKQITEIEKEIKLRSQRGVHAESNGAAALSANGGPCPSLNIPESSPSSAVGLLGTSNGGNNPRMTNQMDMNSASEFVVAGSRAEPGMFDCNDPELEALDPMRPTPPPSPAPSSVPHNMQAASSMHHSLQSSTSLSSQPQIPIPGRMVSYTSSNTSSGTRSANNDGINICSSNSNAPTHSSSSASIGHCTSMAGGPTSVSSTGGGTVGALNNSGLGLSHSSADMILSGDSGVVSSSSASSDIHGIKDVTTGFPKSMSSQRSSAGGALDHHPTSTSTTTNVSMSSPPSQHHSEPSQHNIPPEERLVSCPRDSSPVWVPRHAVNTSGNNPSHRSVNASVRDPLLGKQRYEETPDDDADTDQETDRLLGQNRTDDDYGFYDDKEWKKVKSRSILPSMGKGVVSSIKCAAAAAAASTTPAQQQAAAVASAAAQLLNSTTTSSIASSGNSSNHTVSQKSLVSPQQKQQQQQPQQQQQQVQSPTSDSINQFHDSSSSVLPILPANSSSNAITSSNTSVPSKSKKEKDGVKKKRSKEELVKNPAVLIEGVLFRARYLGSTQLVCEGQPTKATRMMQAEEAVSRIKAQANHNGNVCQLSSPPSSTSPTSVERGNNTLLKDAMSPFNSMKQQQQPQQLQQLQQSDGANQFLYSNPRQPETTTVQDDEDDGDSDMGSAGDEEDDYFNDKPGLVSATLGGSIVDTNALVGTSEASPVIAGGRVLSSSPSDELTVAAVTASGLSVAGGIAPASGSLGSSVPHLSPPYGSALPGTMFRLRFVGSLEVEEEVGTGRRRRKRPKKAMVEEVVTKLKTLAPEGETQPSTEVDLFISTEKIMVLNTDLKEIMMDHALRTISYIADIGDLVVLMARRRPVPSDTTDDSKMPRPPKMICHVFESDEAQYIAQSIGQAFQVAYMEFLKANGIEDHSFVREMDYQEVLNSQEIFGDELQMFAKKELQKEVVVPKTKGEILGVVIVESGWGSMLPTVVIANLAPAGAAARCGQLNIGDQIIAINGVSLVGLPLSTCQNYIKNTKTQTVVKLTVVPCPPVVEVKIKRPDTKYQLGFSVQNGVICSLLRGGIAERGGVRVGHRIIEINNQSVVAVPHEKIVNLLATSVGEINMKTMPTSMFRLLTGQETPLYI